MELQTKVKIPKPNFQITHQDPILSMGSCFAENIAAQLLRRKFQVCSNPFGILYHPLSITKGIQILLQQKKYDESDLFSHNERWHSFDHHSDFSSSTKEETLEKINQQIKIGFHTITTAKVIILTLGTAFLYHQKSENRAVVNCHKLPNYLFEKQLITQNHITTALQSMIENIQQVNSEIQFIFTISPIRHIKDGLIENQKSKATLLLAIHEIIEKYSNTYYFPSYEIALDELRDYRFYTSDMIHLNDTAINYIWNKFSDTFFKKETQQLNERFRKLYLAHQHRPFNAQSKQHQVFLKKQLAIVKQYQKEYSYLDFSEEEQYFSVC